MIYLKILAIVLALFIFLRLVSAFFTILVGNKKIRMASRRMFPLVEMLLWLSYAFWVVHLLFNQLDIYKLLTGSMIVVLVAIFGWYFLRDFVSGIILKAENGFEPGQQIITSEVSGTIKMLGYRSMEVITNEGEYVKLPFSRLSMMNIARPADAGNWVEHVVEFKISAKYKSEKIQNMLEKRLLEMPWIVSGDNIKLRITREEMDNYLVVILFHSISPGMAIKTEENLQIFVREVFA